MNPDGTSDKNLINVSMDEGAVQDFRDRVLEPDGTYTGIIKLTSTIFFAIISYASN